MGKISLILDDEREERLRKMAIEKFGLKRGYLTKALEEAIALWMKENGEHWKPEMVSTPLSAREKGSHV
ncbi:MAG: hypothetical protein QW179_04770 [Candidatus Hadarchaeales archaeon]